MRILVTGSRDWSDYYAVWEALDALSIASEEPVTVVHGACPTGADRFAHWWAYARGVAEGRKGLVDEPHPADWERHGKAAGPRRNADMVALGADRCLAFIKDGSRGATHCADLAEKAGIPVRRFTA